MRELLVKVAGMHIKSVVVCQSFCTEVFGK